MSKLAGRAIVLAALVVAGLAAGAGRVASTEDLRCAAPELRATKAPDGEGSSSITWLGDTLLADAARPVIDERGYAWTLEAVASLLDGAHVVANLEGPLTDRTKVYARRSRWSYNAAPQAAEALAAAGIDVAGLANNHAMDRGPGGLGDTLEALAAAGIAAVGAGFDEASARRPLMLDTPAGRVAVIASGDHYGRRRIARDASAGSAVHDPCGIVEAAREAREGGAALVVAFVHWGSNYTDVQPAQRVLAQLFVDAGYDLVVGHGPQVAQPVEVIEGVPVLYSLGNFVFGTPGRFDERFPGYGLIATTHLDGGRVDSITFRCILTDNDRVGFQPRPCPDDEAAVLFASMHPALEVAGDAATLQVR